MYVFSSPAVLTGPAEDGATVWVSMVGVEVGRWECVKEGEWWEGTELEWWAWALLLCMWTYSSSSGVFLCGVCECSLEESPHDPPDSLWSFESPVLPESSSRCLEPDLEPFLLESLSRIRGEDLIFSSFLKR